MDVVFRSSDAGKDLASLADWLRHDGQLRRIAAVRTGTGPDGCRSGTMGSASDVVTAVLTHAEALAQLVLAFAAWRSQHRGTPTITIELPDRKVVVTAEDPVDAAEIVRRLTDPPSLGPGGADQADDASAE